MKISKKNILWLSVLIITGSFLFIYWTLSSDDKKQKMFNASYKVYTINLPPAADFAGENVPLDQYDVAERFERELLVNTYWQSNTLLLLKRANRWFPLIEKILKKHKIPDDFKYLCAVESGFINVVSPAGAVGFWQILEDTGRELGLEVTEEVDERYDPVKSTEAACKYFITSFNLFNSWTSVAASYNIGMNGYKKAITIQKTTSFYDLMLNTETSRYLFRILVLKEILTHPEKYGFIIEKKDLYEPIKTKIITVDSSIKDLSDFAFKNYINYKYLKIHNPWLRKTKLTLKPGKKYKILIPSRKPEYSPYIDSWLDTLMTDFKDSIVGTLIKDTTNSE